ncbi:hypothetical protein ASPCAL03707 [Aspergillus calidoustus]|uniref:Uncharacterized protein n=1 Tax=Aspergillus calidoustus TaxID=454130 RepID=A0A0U5C429_ASPCI|nr:hypothetical protein ASPCAL03707 [Aspergillus calidoustus]
MISPRIGTMNRKRGDVLIHDSRPEQPRCFSSFGSGLQSRARRAPEMRGRYSQGLALPQLCCRPARLARSLPSSNRFPQTFCEILYGTTCCGFSCWPAKDDDPEEATFLDDISDHQMISWPITKVISQPPSRLC